MSANGRFKLLQFNMQFGQPWDDAYPDHAPINLQLTIDEIRAHDAEPLMGVFIGAGAWPGASTVT